MHHAPLLVLFSLALAACGAPCEEHNGSVDGYCENNTAYNCVTTCADCIDEWKEAPCTGTCTTADSIPPEEYVGGSAPNMSQPTTWAVCSEWVEQEDAG